MYISKLYEICCFHNTDKFYIPHVTLVKNLSFKTVNLKDEKKTRMVRSTLQNCEHLFGMRHLS